MTSTIYVITQKDCPNCPAAKKRVFEALHDTNIAIRIIDLHNMDPDFEFKLLEEQVFIASTPSIIYENNGTFKLLSSGKVPSIQDIRSAVGVHH